MVSTYLHTIISFVRVQAFDRQTDGRMDGRTDGQTDVDSKVRSNEVRCAQK